jgi:hypothetical protein
MKKAIILISIALAGCGSESDSLGYRAVRTTLAVGTLGITELGIAGQERQEGLAKKTCLESGLKENTPAYTKCFIDIKKAQLSHSQVTNEINNQSIRQQDVIETGHKVYNASECIGPVIMGKCEGTIQDTGGYHKTCHGEMLNGQCTGPMF